ncbi:MAG: magnesium transporter [Candidatus Hatepunaea meridiana]|nr:magnesium transporter [Candidatus Hatepunaea meridiana]
MSSLQSKHTHIPLDPNRWLELVETGNQDDLRRELINQHPADIAFIIEQLPYELQRQLFDLVEPEAKPDVVAELDEQDQVRLIGKLPTDEIAAITGELDSDDAADLLGVLKDEQAASVLDHLDDEDRTELIELMAYDEDSAGGIMAKEALSVPMDTSVDKVINHLRTIASEVGDIYSIYVIDNYKHLRGYLSLKRLILSQPDQLISEIMKTDIVPINVVMDREEVAELFRKYDLASAPVVDDQNRFLGRITHDDILNIMVEEADEDIGRLSGHVEFDPGERSVFRNLKHRLPWLMLGLLGGLIAARMIAYFEPQLSSITALIFYLPLVAAMGGNAGIQTSSLMVRGFATGEISDFAMSARIFGELGVAFLSGLCCSVILFSITWFWQQNIILALVVSLSVMAVIFLAAIVGVLIPLVLKKYGLDPALATGPFITTANDIFGLLIYLGIALLFLVNQ